MATEVRTPAVDAQEATTQQRAGAAATLLQKRLLGYGLVLLALLLAYLFLVFWPAGVPAEAGGNTQQTIYLLGEGVRPLKISLDVRLILMVMMAGGLGSFIHTATSFSDYVGNEKLTVNWLWWYVQRPFIGMMLAVIFYLVIRGGFLSAGTNSGSVNAFGIAALSGLVGMFSKQATDKLSEVFDTLFRTAPGAGDSKRKDDLHNPVPVLTDVEPRNVLVKTANVVVTVRGSGFVKGASLRVRESARETEFVDATRLTAKLLDDDVANTGELEVTVFNPGPGGGTSTPIKIRIDDPPPPPPGDGGGGGQPTQGSVAAGGNGHQPAAESEEAMDPPPEGEPASEDVEAAEAGVRPDDPDR